MGKYGPEQLRIWTFFTQSYIFTSFYKPTLFLLLYILFQIQAIYKFHPIKSPILFKCVKICFWTILSSRNTVDGICKQCLNYSEKACKNSGSDISKYLSLKEETNNWDSIKAVPAENYYLQTFLIWWLKTSLDLHCVESVQIQSYFWFVFSCIRTECRKIRTRNNSVFGHFSRSVNYRNSLAL